MPDDLHPIVQRMIDAGESEENIATVIQHYKTVAPPTPSAPSTPVSDSEPGTFWGGFKKSLIDQATHAMGSTDENNMATFHAASPEVEKFVTTPIARPTGVDAIDGFLSPASLAMMGAAGAIGGGAGAVKRGVVGGAEAVKRGAVAAKNKLPITGTLRMGGRFLSGVSDFDTVHPLKSTVGKLGDAMQRVADQQGSPNATWTQKPAPVTGLAPEPSPLPEPPPRPTVGQLRMAAGQGGQSAPTITTPMSGGIVEPTAIPNQLPSKPGAPPLRVDPASLPPDWKTAVPDQVGHALDPARVDIGAEQAGRATGMTKQQVRDVATPILDAAPGQASPILPEAALKRIVDTLKGLPKGGPEREAYVAKATSGKTQWQIENIRRTLEHLGLIVPIAAAVGSGSVRDEVMKRLRANSGQGASQ